MSGRKVKVALMSATIFLKTRFWLRIAVDISAQSYDFSRRNPRSWDL